MAILGDISTGLQTGQHEPVAELTQRAIDQGIDASEILSGGLLAGMDVVGERFRAHEIFLPQVLLAARALVEAP